MVTAPFSTLRNAEPAPSRRAPAGARPRFDPFRTLPPEQRARERRAYLEFIRANDGEIDWENWCLPVRDERMQALAGPVEQWDGHIDIDSFYQLLHRVGKPDTDDATLWATLIALANEGERYGVDVERRMLARRRARGAEVDPMMVYHLLQEDYHTRLVNEACRSIGLEGVTQLKPRLVHRLIMRAMTYLPNGIRYSLVLLGEAIASVVFERLHDLCTLFESTPEAAERLRGIIGKVRDEEMLHTLHCRSRLGPLGLGFARALVPISAWIVELAYPQIRRLGLDRHVIVAGVRRGIEIPEGANWVQPDPIAAT